MRFLFLFLCLAFSVFSAFAQGGATDEILATTGKQNFTAADLPPQIGDNYRKSAQIVKDLRSELLAQQVANMLLDSEAKSRKITIEKLIETEVTAKLPAPPEAQIQAVYNANKAQIGDKPLSAVRPEIVSFLQREPQQKALIDFIEKLKPLHKAAVLKDVNAPFLQPVDAVATVDGKQITAREFEEGAGEDIYETRIAIYDQTVDALDQIVFSSLVSTEAKSLNIQPEELIAHEITDKMKEFSPGEREKLQADLGKRLAQKYGAKILIKEPAPYVRKVAILPANPSRGNISAPVTVVMFTDFQCPACSASHPVLQSVLAEYGDKIHFVVRDFPLTQLHPNAYNAALAAAAANAQGKFFEYTEILYKNQDKLDIASLKNYATTVGLNRQRFDADLDGKKFEADVVKDMQDGAGYGIGGTPTIYINGVKARELSASAFRRLIEQALKK